MILFIICTILICMYSKMIYCNYLGFRNIEAFVPEKNTSQRISIIIPCRNEAQHLPKLLYNLTCQNATKGLFEVIVIDDHSEDNTFEVAEAFCKTQENFSVQALPQNKMGKKAAIACGVLNSKYAYIATIDADCTLSDKWFNTVGRYCELFKPQLLIGPVIYDNEKGGFEKMQSLEVMSLVAAGAGSAGRGKAMMCNGSNLIFTKELYEQAMQYKRELASGDDMFLLEFTKATYPNNICFIKSLQAAVRTEPEPTVSAFLQQRKRWASKSLKYSDKDIIRTGLLVFATNFSLVILLMSSALDYRNGMLYVLLLAIKSVPDYLLIRSFAKCFKKSELLPYLWLTQLMYPVYTTAMALRGSFGTYTWKQRICK